MKIRILEVGPRDGLQNEKKMIPTEQKYALIELLIKAGLTHIEAGAFVNPKAVPQMADSKELLQSVIKDFPQVTFHSLVPNLKGLENALSAGVKNIGLLTACSESFTQKNLNTSIKGSITRIAEILEECPKDVFKRLYISMSFHSPWEGVISNEAFSNTMERCADLGVNEIVISDTTGKGTPDLVNNRIFLSQKFFGVDKIACHFHDTYSNGLANIKESIKCRVDKFDSSINGLGGCPYSPGATGNISTDSLVDFCIENNIETSISREKLKVASEYTKSIL